MYSSRLRCGAINSFDFLAAFFYPGGYDYYRYYCSDLGAVAAKNGELSSISSSLFFVALTVVATTLIPFWLVLHSLFIESKVEKSWVCWCPH